MATPTPLRRPGRLPPAKGSWAGWLARLRAEWRPGVARRIVTRFMLAASVPIVVMAAAGWWGLQQLAQRDAVELRGEQVRNAGMAVLDRLLMARALVQAWPQPQALTEMPAQLSAAGLALPGLGSVFQAAVLQGEDGRIVWRSDTAATAAAEMLPRRLPDAAGPASSLAHDRAGGARLQVLVAGTGAQAAGAATQLWLGLPVATRPGLHWWARIAPGPMWDVFTRDEADVQWCIRTAGAPAQTVYCAPQLARPAAAPSERVVDRWELFLGGNFASPDWHFERHTLVVPFTVGGYTLGRWVGHVTAATLIVVFLVGIAQVRRTLGPLHQLMRGTRRLARREPGVRVRVHGHDEFGALAYAFNEMAARIDEQIDTMHMLAQIDRLIVLGRPLEDIIDRVLAQACAVVPRSSALVVWQELQPRPHLRWRRWQVGSGEVASGQLSLEPAQRAAFDQLAQAQWWWRDQEPVPAWCEPLWQAGAEVLWLLPVQAARPTRALLLIGVAERDLLRGPVTAGAEAAPRPAPQLDRERRLRVEELRDRLAVAHASHERQRVLVHQAVHDSLTGLANRQGLHDSLEAALCARQGARLALLYIDLDRFKEVNDGQGHDVGDELLRQAAARLCAITPQARLVSRPGGDEFVIVLEGVDQAAACATAEEVCQRLAHPFNLKGRSHFLGASVGVALAPQHGRSRAHLLRHADMAMYAAKQRGRGCWTLFEESLDANTQARLQLAADLRVGIGRGELRVWFQPRVGTRDGQIRSAEALVRWQHPQRGLVPPGEFIAVAEESDLIDEIGRWMLNATCAQIARWRRTGEGPERVSVNVSPRQLASARLLGDVHAALAAHRVDPGSLELEVTESLLVGDAHQAREQLAQLRAWGVTIALDDFGTGYSSLATLRDLPIDVMKVDRAFVRDLGSDDTALAITRTVMTLAQTLGKHTVAEGIETERQAQLLRSLGCDELQGFLYSKAVPAEQLPALPGWPHHGVSPAPARDSGWLPLDSLEAIARGEHIPL